MDVQTLQASPFLRTVGVMKGPSKIEKLHGFLLPLFHSNDVIDWKVLTRRANSAGLKLVVLCSPFELTVAKNDL